MQELETYRLDPAMPRCQVNALLALAINDLVPVLQPLMLPGHHGLLVCLRDLRDPHPLGPRPEDDTIVLLGAMPPDLRRPYQTAANNQAQRLCRALSESGYRSTQQFVQPSSEIAADGFHHEGSIVITAGETTAMNMAIGLCAMVVTGQMTADQALAIARLGPEEQFTAAHRLMSEARV